MKSSLVAVTLLFAAASSAASGAVKSPAKTTKDAAATDLLVLARADAQGSMWAGTKSAFTKTFNVSISNLTDKDVDLSTYCLRAYTPDSQSFGVDTADEELLKGTLKKGASVHGVVDFASATQAVYQAAMIKAFHDCR